jgi:hypothetical protein
MYKTWRLSRVLEQSMQQLVYRHLECMKNSLNDGSKDILPLTVSAVLKANKTQSPEDVSISSDDMENMTSQLSLCVSNLYNHVFPTYAIA